VPGIMVEEGITKTASLLSLIIPSCMVAPIRELANITFSTTTKALSSNTLDQMSLNMDIDIDVDVPRGRPSSPSNNSSRESSILSKASTVPYYERMEIQSNNPLWSKQVEAEEVAQSLNAISKENYKSDT